MSYIAQHPWIEPLPERKLRTLATVPIPYAPEQSATASYPRFTSSGADAGPDSAQLTAALRNELSTAPANVLTDAAWDMFDALAETGADEQQDALQAQYLGDVGAVLAAARWAAAPTPQANCEVDVDFDGMDECVLASKTLFAVFERDGGRLAWLFSMRAGQPHEIIGGTEQFEVGLSDRSLWQIERGPAADPRQIPGAFVDADFPWSPYEVNSLGPDSLTLTSADGSRSKAFRLLPGGVSAEYRLQAPLETRISLTLDPWRRFGPGWATAYHSRLQPDTATWTLRGGPSAALQGSRRTAFAAFNDSLDSLYGPENPDQEFPPGHYVPFPMAVADYALQDGDVIQLAVR
jgi:hypothetical protein